MDPCIHACAQTHPSVYLLISSRGYIFCVHSHQYKRKHVTQGESQTMEWEAAATQAARWSNHATAHMQKEVPHARVTRCVQIQTDRDRSTNRQRASLRQTFTQIELSDIWIPPRHIYICLGYGAVTFDTQEICVEHISMHTTLRRYGDVRMRLAGPSCSCCIADSAGWGLRTGFRRAIPLCCRFAFPMKGSLKGSPCKS